MAYESHLHSAFWPKSQVDEMGSANASNDDCDDDCDDQSDAEEQDDDEEISVT
jgi:hypothetical protein